VYKRMEDVVYVAIFVLHNVLVILFALCCTLFLSSYPPVLSVVLFVCSSARRPICALELTLGELAVNHYFDYYLVFHMSLSLGTPSSIICALLRVVVALSSVVTLSMLFCALSPNNCRHPMAIVALSLSSPYGRHRPMAIVALWPSSPYYRHHPIHALFCASSPYSRCCPMAVVALLPLLPYLS